MSTPALSDTLLSPTTMTPNFSHTYESPSTADFSHAVIAQQATIYQQQAASSSSNHQTISSVNNNSNNKSTPNANHAQWLVQWFDEQKKATWKIGTPMFKYCKKRKEHYSAEVSETWYKAPYKYNMLLEVENMSESENVLALLDLNYEDGQQVQYNKSSGGKKKKAAAAAAAAAQANNQANGAANTSSTTLSSGVVSNNENYFVHCNSPSSATASSVANNSAQRSSSRDGNKSEVTIGPFQFNICSYKQDGRKFRMIVYLYTPSLPNINAASPAPNGSSAGGAPQLLCCLVSPPFTIRAKKPIVSPGIKKNKNGVTVAVPSEPKKRGRKSKASAAAAANNNSSSSDDEDEDMAGADDDADYEEPGAKKPKMEPQPSTPELLMKPPVAATTAPQQQQQLLAMVPAAMLPPSVPIVTAASATTPTPTTPSITSPPLAAALAITHSHHHHHHHHHQQMQQQQQQQQLQMQQQQQHLQQPSMIPYFDDFLQNLDVASPLIASQIAALNAYGFQKMDEVKRITPQQQQQYASTGSSSSSSVNAANNQQQQQHHSVDKIQAIIQLFQFMEAKERKDLLMGLLDLAHPVERELVRRKYFEHGPNGSSNNSGYNHSNQTLGSDVDQFFAELL